MSEIRSGSVLSTQGDEATRRRGLDEQVVEAEM